MCEPYSEEKGWMSVEVEWNLYFFVICHRKWVKASIVQFCCLKLLASVALNERVILGWLFYCKLSHPNFLKFD